MLASRACPQLDTWELWLSMCGCADTQVKLFPMEAFRTVLSPTEMLEWKCFCLLSLEAGALSLYSTAF